MRSGVLAGIRNAPPWRAATRILHQNGARSGTPPMGESRSWQIILPTVTIEDCRPAMRAPAPGGLRASGGTLSIAAAIGSVLESGGVQPRDRQ